MIVSSSDLGRYAGKVTMADGGFDPLHHGHVAYLEAAAGLGLPVFCNVSSDEYVARKHPPFLDQAERGAILDAIRFVDYVHLSQVETVEVLRLLRPRSYAKGADWRAGLPEAEQDVCAELGIEVVYLDTVLDSSTAILERYAGRQRP
jgi:D-beta-D-heptose 7-phosphate kinase / D-beta-D-heptose 1-phosphate adenosyltransferase